MSCSDISLHLVRACAAAFAGFAALAATASTYDDHVLFMNAAADGGLAGSQYSCVAPSTIEVQDGRFPTDRAHVVSPPNALRLHWRSAPGGDWQITLKSMERQSHRLPLLGQRVALWCYADSEITALNSPRLYLKDRADKGSFAVTLVRGDERIPAGRWVRVLLDFSGKDNLYQGTDDPRFSLADAVSVTFMQGLDDNAEHTIWLDDIMVVDADAPAAAPAAAPTGLAARGYERHCDLAWQPAAAGDALAYRIYRSWDGKDYTVVGTQRGSWHRYEDFTGSPGRTAWYKVSSVNLDGRESPPSDAVSATTRPMTDDELLTMVQEACFRYYWEAGHPNAGLAPELTPGDPNLMALGGNGFGVMALLVASERGFVPRDEAAARLLKIVRFLAGAERFHGAWGHFLDGRTGKVIPYFGQYDDGGDLVETAFMMQGLLAARQYFNRDTPAEREIRDAVTQFWRGIEWDWYRQQPDGDVLYWHWSPDHGFHIRHPLIGWNETLIIYLLAIASPTHPVPASLWHTGWAGQSDRNVAYRRNWSRTTQGDHFTNGNTYYGTRLEVGEGTGAELFFTHFSFMGFDPRGLRDRYTNYFANNRAIALIQHAYAVANPMKFKGYGADSWGRSAGVNAGGGRALPRDDNGTINVMASLASLPYTPQESMAALRHFYRDLGPKVWGIYGFHDGFNETENWFDEVYMALNQAPIVVMIENQRTGLVWKNFMANPEIKPALDAIGFKPDK
ncbi:MAG TPA: glucoamylase family protein [Lacunisphaera sp.]|nr:glucoamylase family protein [Lacunisphaera sp.]